MINKTLIKPEKTMIYTETNRSGTPQSTKVNQQKPQQQTGIKNQPWTSAAFQETYGISNRKKKQQGVF